MLPRVLEPEVMDSPDEARDYDAIDHAEVNRRYVHDLLAFLGSTVHGATVLDLGTGTARIPWELCRRVDDVRVVAVDQAGAMLDVAREHMVRESLEDRVQLRVEDAKRLTFPTGSFDVVISNSLAHHLSDPQAMFREARRVCRNGGAIFVRDLVRPATSELLDELVARHAAEANDSQRDMFAASLHAALTLDEFRAAIAELGFDPADVSITSDRHVTWATRRPGDS